MEFSMADNKTLRFTKDFTRQEPIAEEAIARATEILRSGQIHRYNVAAGKQAEAAKLEEEFARYIGAKYCLAVTSCGMAMYLAMKSAGVQPNDTVLCNAFTLAPVPGAIHNTGAQIQLIDINQDYTVDLEDLDRQAATGNARFFLISHMRGHLTDMDKLVAICREHELILIEDCAHTMGASWNGKKSGSFGHVACFSTQTYKHLNSGEGGLLTTNDPEIIAQAILYSGSYMLFDRHTSRPSEETFSKYKKKVPNYSCRMDNLRASLLRHQLRNLDNQCQRWNKRYRLLEERLNTISGISCPQRPEKEYYVGSSIQFSIEGQDGEIIQQFLEKTAERGVELKWFGNPEPIGFTSAYSSWQYLADLPKLTKTDRTLATMCDMRIPLTFDLEDCEKIAVIIGDVAEEIFRSD